MKQGLTLTQLAQELERQTKTKRDFVVPTNLMEIRPVETLAGFAGFELLMGRKKPITMPLLPLAETHIREYGDIPAKYWEKLRNASPAMAANEANFWLQRQNQPRLVRTLDNSVRAVLSNSYRTVDNYDVATVVLDVLLNAWKDDIEVVSTNVDPNKLYIKATTKRLQFEVRPGDVVQAGLVVSNSEVGLGAVNIEPLLYRLACLNGAVITDRAIRKIHLGRKNGDIDDLRELFSDETKEKDDKLFLDKVQDVLLATFEEENFGRLREVAINSTGRRIEGPIEKVLDRVVERFDLKERERGGILQRLAEGGDGLTQWSLANAVTNLANDEPDYERASTLERIGGSILALDNKQWRDVAVITE